MEKQLIELQQNSIKHMAKNTLITFITLFLAGNIGLTYSSYKADFVLRTVIYFSVIILVFITIILIINHFSIFKPIRQISYAVLFNMIYLIIVFSFPIKGTLIVFPILLIFVTLLFYAPSSTFFLSLLCTHIFHMLYHIFSTPILEIKISSGFYALSLILTLLHIYILLDLSKLTKSQLKDSLEHLHILKEKNDELKLLTHKMSLTESQLSSKFKETDTLKIEFEKLYKKYQSLIRHASEGLVDYDINTQRFVFSEQACKIFGETTDRLIDWSVISDRIVEEDKDDFALLWSKLIEGITVTEEIHIRYKNIHEQIITLFMRFSRYHEGNENHDFIVGLIQDVTEKTKAADRINYLAFNDYITDLPNRNRFLQLGQGYIEKQTKNLYCIVLDVDHFRHFNEKKGFDNGNRLLRHIGDALNNTFRNKIISRVYGNTFAIMITPDSSIEQTLESIDSILKSLALLNFDEKDFSCTYATCEINDYSKNCELWLIQTEELMYKAKKEAPGSYVIL